MARAVKKSPMPVRKGGNQGGSKKSGGGGKKKAGMCPDCGMPRGKCNCSY